MQSIYSVRILLQKEHLSAHSHQGKLIKMSPHINTDRPFSLSLSKLNLTLRPLLISEDLYQDPGRSPGTTMTASHNNYSILSRLPVHTTNKTETTKRTNSCTTVVIPARMDHQQGEIESLSLARNPVPRLHDQFKRTKNNTPTRKGQSHGTTDSTNTDKSPIYKKEK